MNKSCGIYKITNIINNKIYIGQSINIGRRWKDHKSQGNWEANDCFLYRVFKKYGLENFKFEIIENCSPSKLNEKEREWILKTGSFGSGYNCDEGGTNPPKQLGENNTNAILTEKEVLEIREYKMQNKTKKEVYENYKERIGPSGFDLVWRGVTWKHCFPKDYDESVISPPRSEGEGNRKMTKEEVISIRKQKREGAPIKKVREPYRERICANSFLDIWNNKTWKGVE